MSTQGQFPVSRLRRGPLLLTLDADHPSHFIEIKALAALDYPPIIVMFPWGNHEHATLCASVKAAASRLSKGCEAVFLKHDNGKTMLECCLHHSLFSWTNAWRDEDRPVLGM